MLHQRSLSRCRRRTEKLIETLKASGFSSLQRIKEQNQRFRVSRVFATPKDLHRP